MMRARSRMRQSPDVEERDQHTPAAGIRLAAAPADPHIPSPRRESATASAPATKELMASLFSFSPRRRWTPPALRAAASLIATLALVASPSQVAAQAQPPPAASQNPSPMVEETRAHERLVQKEVGGLRRSFTGPAGRSFEILLPDSARTRAVIDLVVHFHGAAWLPEQAVAQLGTQAVVVVNLGTGSGAYDRAFR